MKPGGARVRRRGQAGLPVAVLLALALAALAGLVALAGPAAAHAELASSSPAEGAELATAPTEVTLTFSEAVSITERSLVVLDPGGERVDDGSVVHPDGAEQVVRVGLRPGAATASYAVLWRVTSDDNHPLSGTFSFGVGVPAESTEAGRAGGSPLVGGLHTAARGAAYAGLVVLVGGATFFAGLWPAGAAGRGRRVLLAGGLAVALSSAALFLLEGPYTAGLGLGQAFSGSLLAETLGTRYGKLLLVHLLLLALAVPVLRRLHERGRASASDLVGLGAALLLTFSLLGHAGAGNQVVLAAAADAAHLGAACVWLGGLVVLATVALRPARWAAATDAADLHALLPRWHRVAATSVAVLVVTGTYASWRLVGTPAALPATAYGRLLLVKLGAFLLLLALADQARRWVRRHAGARRPVVWAAASVATGPVALAPDVEPDAWAVRRLRRSVAVELVVGAAILAITAVLVTVAPPRDTYRPPEPANAVNAVVEPGGSPE